MKAAHELGRNSIGIDLSREYCDMAEAAVGKQLALMEEAAAYGT
ncbi:hypothetical protein [Thiomonas sp.]